ncbi:MAG: type IV secretory system conjugative DNA transfer family protein [Thaumarchaeota archaeon]|nr:type IV secretory system conjugative DNA transfer family protein [Nitrososphaerota archaeon]
MQSAIDDDDVIFHSLFIGSTGAGKTNAMLYWLRRLFMKRRDVALVLIDPHGDAAIDLFRGIPNSERERVTLLDPNYVTFGLNPLSLPPGLEGPARTQTIQTQVEQLSVLLSDVFSTDASTAPRLMWIFKGALYYLYTLDDRPTFKDLYRILVDFISMPKEEISIMLKSREIEDEIIESTMEAISKLPKEAFASVVNRISNFTLPPRSITSRTFCSRTSKLDFEEMMTPGKLTIFRLPKSLPHDFRRLLSASVVMRFYFAMEKRASRLEAAGEEPSARTPVILAMDEFQNISDLKLLDTILSESRKYGLYLWMVNQNIQQIRGPLFSSVSGNVGAIFCFRVGPDDASRMADLISPQRAERVRKDLIRLRDYSCIARLRPREGEALGRPLLVDGGFPKVHKPLCSMNEAIDHMRNEMEEKYGGAQEATDLVYKTIWEQINGTGEKPRDSSRMPFMPIHWRILTIGYLKLISDAYSLEFSRLRSELYAKYSWQTSTVQQALNELVNTGYLTQTFDRQEYVMRGKDVYGNPIMVPPNPDNRDEMDRARTIIYSLTVRALQWFEIRAGPAKMGDAKHVRVIEKLLKEEYWPMGYYCVVDQGETARERPDIAVLKPALTVTVGRNGNEMRGPNAYAWDYSSVVAVEVEMSPQKGREQVLKNYRKNKAFYAMIRFVATSDDHAQQLAKILGEEPTADPVKYRIDVVEFESLNVIRPRETPQDARRAPEPNAKLAETEGAILDYILLQGFKDRKDVVDKLRGVGITISKRSVSRILKLLVEKGFLTMVGNGYEPTDSARARPKQGTL